MVKRIWFESNNLNLHIKTGFAHIIGMGKSFFYVLFFALTILFLLFVPFFFSLRTYFDVKTKKVAFSLFFFNLIKVFGGYATLYAEGIAFHVRRDKAVLLPLKEMGDQRKKFSFTECFVRTKTCVFTQTGAEYLALGALFHGAISAYFLQNKTAAEERSLLYLTNGDDLRISASVEFYFNFYMLVKEGISAIKEKLRENARKKRENS